MEVLLPLSLASFAGMLTASLTVKFLETKKKKDFNNLVETEEIKLPLKLSRDIDFNQTGGVSLIEGPGTFILKITFRNKRNPIIVNFYCDNLSEAIEKAKDKISILEENDDLNGVKIIRFGRSGKKNRFAYGQGFHVKRNYDSYEFIRLRDLR